MAPRHVTEQATVERCPVDGELLADPAHPERCRKSHEQKTTNAASLFDMKALNLDDPEHG